MLFHHYKEEGIANTYGRAVGHMTILGGSDCCLCPLPNTSPLAKMSLNEIGLDRNAQIGSGVTHTPVETVRKPSKRLKLSWQTKQRYH
jgi:hypothetical protein